MALQKSHQPRITLVAGIILIVVTVMVGVTVFVVMMRHAETLLSKGLQSSLQNRVELTQSEISSAYDRTVVAATRPQLINQMQKLGAGKDQVVVKSLLNDIAKSFYQTGFTAFALLDEKGQEVAKAGQFSQKPALSVKLVFPGQVKLMSDGGLLLHVEVDMQREGHVMGKVVTESMLPAIMHAFKDASHLGKTGELALCAPLDLQMECFPTTLNPNVMTIPKRSSAGELLPMGYALDGQTGFVTTRDYRHQEVVAAYSPVGDVGLGMVFKMDSAELYAPVWQQLRYLIPLLFGVLIVALLLLRWLFAPLVVRLVKSEAEAAQRTVDLTREMAEHKLAEAEAVRFKNVLDNTLDMIFMFEPETMRIVYLNQGAILRSGYSREEWLSMNPSQVTPKISDAEFRQHLAPLLSGEKSSLHFETIQRRKDGTEFPVDISLQLVKERGGNSLFVAILREITERKKAEMALLAESKKNEALLQAAGDGIHVLDLNGNVVLVNDAFSTMLGYTPEEMKGMNVSQWEAERTFSPEELRKRLLELMETSEIFETRHRSRDGRVIDVEVNVVGVEIDDKKMLFCAARDITDKKKSNELIWQQANFDTLTGLPNRRMFYDRLEQEIRKSHRSGLPMAMLLLDLDRFKEVNDDLGHAQGDMLLIEAARRISACVRETDTAARLGGDEFVVILSELKDINSVGRIAQKIVDRLAAPFQLLQETAYVSASIGITLYPGDAQDIDMLVKNADQAMYLAKKSGRGRFSYFTASLQEAAQTRLRLLSDLRNALPGKQLSVHYQPIVEIASGRIFKAEALLRWQHPERGMVSPMQFIPLAEESGLINEIGNWVFHEAIGQLKRMREKFDPQFQISVNKSPVQFRQNGGDCVAWPDHLRTLNLPGQSLVIEITEGLLLHAEKGVTERLLSFRDAGIQVALDDFGTGYSSLSYLKKFDIDYLKIDQSFVRHLADDPDDQALCEAIIVMAHKLGLKVIAEGVETEQQRDLLNHYGCDFAQGWLYSKAVPVEEFEALLRGQNK